MYQPSSNQQSLALTEEDDYGQDESYDDYGQYGDGSYDGQMMDPSMAGGADGNKGRHRFLIPKKFLNSFLNLFLNNMPAKKYLGIKANLKFSCQVEDSSIQEQFPIENVFPPFK